MTERPAEDGIQPGTSRRGRRRGVLAVALLLLAAAVAGVVLWSPWRAELPEDAAFRAYGSVVSELEVQRRTEVLRALYGVQVPEDPDLLDRFRRDTAKAMAVSLVLDRAVEDAGIDVADKAVSDALDRFLAQRYPQGGRAAYVQALAAQGVGEKDVLAEIRRQLQIARLFEDVTADVEVTDQELRALFEDDPALYAVPERRRLRHVVVADEAAAQAVLRSLRDGGDFAAVARQSSLDGSTKDQGGDLGTVSATELDPAFGQAAFAVASGQLFGPVQTPLGWHVGRVDAVVPGEPTTFEQVRDQLREQQVTERRVALWRDFVAREVRDADVVYAAAYRPADPLPDVGAPPSPGPGTTPQPSSAPPR